MKIILSTTLQKIVGLNKFQKEFMLKIFTIILALLSKVNFLNLDRCGRFYEQIYRRHFRKLFQCLFTPFLFPLSKRVREGEQWRQTLFLSPLSL